MCRHSPADVLDADLRSASSHCLVHTAELRRGLDAGEDVAVDAGLAAVVEVMLQLVDEGGGGAGCLRRRRSSMQSASLWTSATVGISVSGFGSGPARSSAVAQRRAALAWRDGRW